METGGGPGLAIHPVGLVLSILNLLAAISFCSATLISNFWYPRAEGVCGCGHVAASLATCAWPAVTAQQDAAGEFYNGYVWMPDSRLHSLLFHVRLHRLERWSHRKSHVFGYAAARACPASAQCHLSPLPQYATGMQPLAGTWKPEIPPAGEIGFPSMLKACQKRQYSIPCLWCELS